LENILRIVLFVFVKVSDVRLIRESGKVLTLIVSGQRRTARKFYPSERVSLTTATGTDDFFAATIQ
jgi:hypothetical protein